MASQDGGAMGSAMALVNDPTSDLALAHRLADIADGISLGRYQAIDLIVETKPDATPVTDADRAVEQEIRTLLRTERPEDLIIGEEFGGVELLATAKPGSRFWVIDPIDGTKNFLRGIPTWATLIAMGVVADSKASAISTDSEIPASNSIEIGVVSAPALGRRWWAKRGSGSFVTENFAPASPLPSDTLGSTTASSTRKISVSKVAQLSDASLSYSDLVGWGERRQPFIALLDRVWRTRALGDFLSHMLVAEGAVDLAAEPSLALWDMAPLALIVEEAGGRYSSLDGVDGPFGKSGVSSNSRLHDLFLSTLASQSRDYAKGQGE